MLKVPRSDGGRRGEDSKVKVKDARGDSIYNRTRADGPRGAVGVEEEKKDLKDHDNTTAQKRPASITGGERELQWCEKAENGLSRDG